MSSAEYMSPDIMRWCYNFQRFRIISRKDTHSGRWLDISATASNTGTNHYFWTIFFFNFVWKKLFKRWPIRPDLCLECCGGFLSFDNYTFTVFCPKAIKMFDVEMFLNQILWTICIRTITDTSFDSFNAAIFILNCP